MPILSDERPITSKPRKALSLLDFPEFSGQDIPDPGTDGLDRFDPTVAAVGPALTSEDETC